MTPHEQDGIELLTAQTVLRETERAWLVEFTNGVHEWFPKSHVLAWNPFRVTPWILEQKNWLAANDDGTRVLSLPMVGNGNHEEPTTRRAKKTQHTDWRGTCPRCDLHNPDDMERVPCGAMMRCGSCGFEFQAFGFAWTAPPLYDGRYLRPLPTVADTLTKLGSTRHRGAPTREDIAALIGEIRRLQTMPTAPPARPARRLRPTYLSVLPGGRSAP